MTTLVVFGSSRSRGNTKMAIDAAFSALQYRLLDLNQLSFSEFDYAHQNRDDDFRLVGDLLVSHDPIVLASPVYWYSMSATMKRFMDRLSDLITIRKPLGRALAGRRLFVIATSTNPQLPAGFEQTFRSTADYLDMSWGGSLHIYFEKDLEMTPAARSAARRFGQLVIGSQDETET